MIYLTKIDLTDEETNTPDDVQLLCVLDETNWPDWTRTPHAVYSSDGATAITFHRTSFDADNKIAVLTVRKPTAGLFPLKVTPDGPDLSDFDATFDRFPEGTGLVESFHFDGDINGEVGSAYTDSSFTGTIGTGDAGKFGNDTVRPLLRFSGGHHLSFDGVDDFARWPGLLILNPPDDTIVSFFMRVTGDYAPPSNTFIFDLTQFQGQSTFFLFFAPGASTTLQMVCAQVGADNTSSTIAAKIIEGGGVKDAETYRTFFIAMTAGLTLGHALYVDCIPVASNFDYKKKIKSYPASSFAGVMAPSLYLGCQGDPRAEYREGYGKFDIDGLRIEAHTDGVPIIRKLEQLMHRMTPFQIETPRDRLTFAGVAVSPLDVAVSDNSVSEPSRPILVGDTLHMVYDCGNGGANRNRIMATTATAPAAGDGLLFTGATHILGLDAGGYAGATHGPEFVNDTTIIFGRSKDDDPDGSLFEGGFGVATYDAEDITATYNGIVDVEGFDDVDNGGHGTGNCDAVEFGGTWYGYFDFEGPYPTEWYTRVGTAAAAGGPYTMFKDDPDTLTTFPGYQLGSPFTTYLGGSNGGTSVTKLSDGSAIALMHSEDNTNSIYFKRFAPGNFKTPIPFDPYHLLFERRQGALDELGTGWLYSEGHQITQFADAEAINAFDRAWVLIDVLEGNSKAAICSAYCGSPTTPKTTDDLFAPNSVSLTAVLIPVVPPVSPRTFVVDWGTTGVNLFYRVLDNSDAVLIARNNIDVTEFPAGSGLYRVTISNWDDTWEGRIIWDDGSGDFAQESFSVPPSTSGGDVTIEETDVSLG